MFEELRNSCRPGMIGGFLPGVKQIANVAALPGRKRKLPGIFILKSYVEMILDDLGGGSDNSCQIPPCIFFPKKSLNYCSPL